MVQGGAGGRGSPRLSTREPGGLWRAGLDSNWGAVSWAWTPWGHPTRCKREQPKRMPGRPNYRQQAGMVQGRAEPGGLWGPSLSSVWGAVNWAWKPWGHPTRCKRDQLKRMPGRPSPAGSKFLPLTGGLPFCPHLIGGLQVGPGSLGGTLPDAKESS